MRITIKVITAVVILFAAGGWCARAEVLSQNFDSWGGATSAGTYTNNGWIVYSGRVSSLYGAYSSTNSGWLLNDGTYPPLSYLQTPTASNGVGSLIFWAKNKTVASIEFQIRTNGSVYCASTIELSPHPTLSPEGRG